MFTHKQSQPTTPTTKKPVKSWLSTQLISDRRLHVEFKDTQQAHLVLGWPGLALNHPDRYAMALLSTILGGNMSSRLFIEVREKRGLGYYIHSDVGQYHDGGMFGASAGVDPTRITEALRVTIDQFTQLVASDRARITEAELQKAQDYLAGKLILNLEDSESVAQFHGLKQLLLNKIETPDQVLAKYRAVTMTDIKRVIRNLIRPGQLRLAIIGPFKEHRQFEEIINL